MKRSVFYFSFLTIIVSIVNFNGCFDAPKDFVEPTFLSGDYYLPIVNRRYTLYKMVEEDSTIFGKGEEEEGLGLLYFYTLNELNVKYVEDNMRLSPRESRASKRVGDIKINNVAPLSVNIPSPYAGQTTVVPPSSSPFNVNPPAFSEFNYLILNSPSELTVVVENRMPVQMTIRNFRIRNSDLTIVAENLSNFVVPANSRDSMSFSLAGRTLRNSISLEGDIDYAGSGAIVTVPNDAGAYFELKLKSLSIEEASGNLPSQDPIHIDSAVIVIDDSTSYIDTLTLLSGSFDIQFNNQTSVPLNIIFSFPEITNPGGSVLTLIMDVPARDNYAVSRDLAGYKFISQTRTNQVKYNITAYDASPPGFKTINRNDSIAARVILQNAVIQRFTGVIKNTSLENFRTTRAKFDIKKINKYFTYEEINYSEAIVNVRMGTSAGFEVGVEGYVLGNNSYAVDSVRIPFTVLTPGVLNKIELDRTETAAFFNRFANQIPDSLMIKSKGTLNPNYNNNVGSISNMDSVFGSVEVKLPLKLSLKGGKFVDTAKIDIDEKARKEIKKTNSVEIHLTLENELPVFLRFEGVLMDSLYNPLLTLPTAHQDSVLILPSVVDAEGKLATKVTTVRKFLIVDDDVDKFVDSKFLEAIIRIDTRDNETTKHVEFHVDYGVTVSVSAKINLIVDFND